MPKPRVVLTGAAGSVAQRMFATLADRFELVPLDVSDTTAAGQAVPGLIRCDLSDPNRDAYRAHFADAAAVIHLALAWAPGVRGQGRRENTEANFQADLRNLQMAENVYRTALEESVPRVIAASSIMVNNWQEQRVLDHELHAIGTGDVPVSSEYYGFAKIAGEALGRVYATGAIPGNGHRGGNAAVAQRALEVIQVRIGQCRDDEIDEVAPGDVRALRRALAIWWSARDQAQLFIRCVEAPEIRDPLGLPYQTVFGLSGNTHAYHDLTHTRHLLGYAPQDDSQVRFAGKIAQLLSALR